MNNLKINMNLIWDKFKISLNRKKNKKNNLETKWENKLNKNHKKKSNNKYWFNNKIWEEPIRYWTMQRKISILDKKKWNRKFINNS